MVERRCHTTWPVPRRWLSRVARCAACALALGLSGCSVSLPIAALAPAGDVTGSIARRASALSALLNVEDWRRARAALGVALDPQSNGTAVNWENKETALRGEFTPTSEPYVDEGRVCRHFASVIVAPSETERAGGAACRVANGDWTLISVARVEEDA